MKLLFVVLPVFVVAVISAAGDKAPVDVARLETLRAKFKQLEADVEAAQYEANAVAMAAQLQIDIEKKLEAAAAKHLAEMHELDKKLQAAHMERLAEVKKLEEECKLSHAARIAEMRDLLEQLNLKSEKKEDEGGIATEGAEEPDRYAVPHRGRYDYNRKW